MNKTRKFVVGTVIAALVAGCSAKSSAVASRPTSMHRDNAPTVHVPAPTGQPVISDRDGATACYRATNDLNLYDLRVVEAIGNRAARSTDFNVSLQGQPALRLREPGDGCRR
jgi:hypothetical protein